MITCACCGEPLLIEDAQVVGDEEAFEYWCKLCVELFNECIENSL